MAKDPMAYWVDSHAGLHYYDEAAAARALVESIVAQVRGFIEPDDGWATPRAGKWTFSKCSSMRRQFRFSRRAK